MKLWAVIRERGRQRYIWIGTLRLFAYPLYPSVLAAFTVYWVFGKKFNVMDLLVPAGLVAVFFKILLESRARWTTNDTRYRAATPNRPHLL